MVTEIAPFIKKEGGTFFFYKKGWFLLPFSKKRCKIGGYSVVTVMVTVWLLFSNFDLNS